jgi:hypothetical protein
MNRLRRAALLGATTIAAARALPRPAIAQGIRELKLVTAWGSPKEFPAQNASIERLVRSIAAMSDGQIKVTVSPAGSLMRAFKVFDAVSAGVADMYHVDEKYFQNKSPALSPTDLADQIGALPLAQPVQCQTRHMAVASPQVLELRSARHQQHHAPLTDRLDHRIDQFARGRVDPMRVLQQNQ